MYYSDEIVEEVRSRNDIVEVVSGYVRLQKKGGRYWGLCPFHNEKSASFSVNGDLQVYHCFGCGAGGNVYTFVMNYENYTFPEAVRMLAERAGVALPQEDGSEEARRRGDRRARLLEVNKAAARFFYYQLRSPHGQIGYQYLKKRELTDETMRSFGLGFAGKNGANLVQYLREKGFEDQLIQEAGLASHSEKYGLNSQFWNRVMYPIQDINNRVIGFGGRVMGDGEPKYLNSPETPIFDKRRNLYGLNYARKARSGNIILCEGYMDVIAMHQAGFTLKRYTETVLLAYDSDGAGVKAALRAIGILREAGLTGKVIDMQPYKDPDEFMKGLGKDAFEERIRQAENSFFFEVRILQGQFDMDDPEEKTRFHREIAKKLCEFSEDVERDNYLQAVAGKYYIGIENLRRLVARYAMSTGLAKQPERPKSGIQKKKGPEESARQSQRLLITWLCSEPGLYGRIRRYISAADFTVEIYRRVAERLFAELEEGRANPAGIISMFQDSEEQKEAASLFGAVLPRLDSKQEREKAFHEILLSVKKNSYEYHISHMGADVNALAQAIAGKKALEELAGTHISLD